MNHKWMKLGGFDLIIDNLDNREVKHRVNGCKQCIYCDLRKGHSSTISFFPMLIYYKDGILESIEKLPYQCQGEKFKEVKQSILFTEDEFKV